jgi:membrane fusion protein, heavy metal efflux system
MNMNLIRISLLKVLCLAMLAASVPSIAAPGAHGPDGEHLDDKPAGGGSGLMRLPDGSVNVPKMAQRRMAIRTALAPETEAAFTIELSGRVLMDPNAGGKVQPAHGGRIEPGPKGLPVAGQSVRKGDVLAFVRHHAEPFAEAAQAAQLAELKAARIMAEARVKRLEGLEGTTPRKDILAAKTELDSLLERERYIGGSLRAREPLTAPVDGVIARADAVIGQIVDAREVLFEVVHPARLVIEAASNDAALGGRIAAATLQGSDGILLKYQGAARSLRDGMLPLTFRVEGAKGGLPLAIGQPVTVIAHTKDKVKGIVIPAQAIVRNPANEPVVWIKSGAERFLPQPVQFRPLDAKTVIVTSGLGADNRVVVAGAPLIAQIR